MDYEDRCRIFAGIRDAIVISLFAWGAIGFLVWLVLG